MARYDYPCVTQISPQTSRLGVWKNQTGCVALKISGCTSFLSWVKDILTQIGLPWQAKIYDVKPGRMWCNLQLTSILSTTWAYKNWACNQRPRLGRKWEKVESYLLNSDWIIRESRIDTQRTLDCVTDLICVAPKEKQASIKERIKKIATRKNLKLPDSWNN